MSDSIKMFFPANLLVLDVIGTVLLVLGLTEFFSVTWASELLSQQFNLNIESIEYHLVVIGVLLMLPLPVNIVKNITKKKDGSMNS